MSTVWKLEKDLCRCCHSEGSFHNLLQPRFVQGQEEYYLEMLRQSFDIELEPVPGVINELTFKICETCIIRLRDAANFKQQVLLCEKRFKEVYKDILKALTPSDNSKNFIKVEVEIPSTVQQKFDGPSTLQDNIKEEVDRLDDDDDDFHMHFDDEDNEPLFDLKNEDSKKSSSKVKKEVTTAKKKKRPIRTYSKQVKKKTDGDEAQAETEAEAAEGSEQPKKGVAKIAKIKFYLSETDYKREGEEYVCTHCDKKIKKLDTLRFHLKKKHYNFVRKFICTYCNKEFDSCVPLNAHKIKEHNVNDRFKCNACDVEYNFSRQLLLHRNQYHMLGETRKCERCEYEAFSAESMARHMVKHKTTKDFHCKFCKKSFLRKNTLNQHEKIHTGEKNKVCKECGQAFVQKASLNYHMVKYHPEVHF